MSVTSSPSTPSFWIGGTLANEPVACESRYLAAFHTLSLLSRNSSQCSFRCRRIVRWKSYFARFAVLCSSASCLPCRRIAHALFLQYVYDFLSAVRSSFHHLFVYGDGLARGQCASRALATHVLLQCPTSSKPSTALEGSFPRLLQEWIIAGVDTRNIG